MKQLIEIDCPAGWRVTFVQVNQYAETVKVKLESDHEHRVITRHGTEVLWLSAEKKRQLFGVQS